MLPSLDRLVCCKKWADVFHKFLLWETLIILWKLFCCKGKVAKILVSMDKKIRKKEKLVLQMQFYIITKIHFYDQL